MCTRSDERRGHTVGVAVYLSLPLDQLYEVVGVLKQIGLDGFGLNELLFDVVETGDAET